jgi:hypothetical protein
MTLEQTAGRITEMKDGARCFGAYVVLLELIVPLHMEFYGKDAAS